MMLAEKAQNSLHIPRITMSGRAVHEMYKDLNGRNNIVVLLLSFFQNLRFHPNKMNLSNFPPFFSRQRRIHKSLFIAIYISVDVSRGTYFDQGV